MSNRNTIILKTVDQIIDEFCLFDDTFMSMVFDRNIEATQLLLHVILERDDITVTEVIGQHELKNPEVGGRNVRLDIHAKDATKKEFDIEVQRSSGGADVKRARFNSGAMDIRMLKTGQPFSEMKEVYTIFITEKDVMGKGFPIYHAERVILETGELFDDGSHIIYVNGAYDNTDSPIGKLVHDFHCTKASDMMYNILAKQVKHFKETEGGRKEMCKLVEDYADQKAAQVAEEVAAQAEERRLDTLHEAIKNAMDSFHITLVQAMDGLKISEADRAVLAKRF